MLFRQGLSIALVGLWLALVPMAAVAQIPSQNLPPPGGYQAIPNFSGPGAGLEFRTAINDRFGGSQAISPKFVTLSFANLPAEQDGLLLYCSDCTQSIPCAGGGTGAWAFGQNGEWTCTAPNLPGNAFYSGASNATGSLGLNAVTGSGTTPSISGFSVNGRINVKAYGAVGDAMAGTDGTTTSGSTTFASSGTNCTSSRVGEVINVAGAGASGANLSTTVASCSGNNFVMAAAAGTSISGTAKWVIGHDDTTAIQSAVDAAKASNGTLFFPKTGANVGVAPYTGPAYLITSPINFGDSQNLRVTGPGALIFPDTGGIAFDLTGDSRCSFTHLSLFAVEGLATPSTVGFYQARNANGTGMEYYPSFNKFTQNTVALQADSTANGGNGTVAIYNVGGAEQNTYVDNTLAGDHALVLTYSNLYSITSPNYTIAPSISLTNDTFIANDMRSVGTGAPVVLDGVGTMQFYNDYIGNDGAYTSNPGTGPAIEVAGNTSHVVFNGPIEGYAWAVQFDAGTTSQGDEFNATSGNAAHFTGGYDILANGGTATTVEGSSFRLSTNAASVGYPLIGLTGTNGTFTDNVVYTGPPDSASMSQMTLSGASWTDPATRTVTGTLSPSSLSLTNTSGANVTFAGTAGGGHPYFDAFGNFLYPTGAPHTGDNWRLVDENGNSVLTIYVDGTEAADFAGTVSTGAFTVSTLPSTCSANQIVTVTDATSFTAGACTGGGSDHVLAVCQGSNTWSCM